MKRAWLVAVVFALSRSAQGQSTDRDRAQELFSEANDLHDKGDLKGALVKYELANQLGHTVVTAYELAKAYAEQGRLLDAKRAVDEVDKITIKVNESDKTKHAREEAAKLSAQLEVRIPKLIVTLDNVAPGTTPGLTVDDQPALPAQPRKLDPGRHAVAAIVPNGPPVTATVDLSEGETRALALTLPQVIPTPPPPHDLIQPQKQPDPTPAPPVMPPRDSSTWSTGKSLGVVAVVGGGVSALVSLVTGTITLGKANTVKDHCNPQKQCDSEGLAAARSGSTLALITNITLFGGIGLMVGGAILAIVSGDKKTEHRAATWWTVSPERGGGASASLGIRF
jgi:hypothetical protein